MRSPLNKRLFRELRGEFGKYLVIFILMTLTIGMVSGFLVADGSMIQAYEESFEKYSIENGHFRTEKKMNNAQIQDIEDLGIKLYENYYVEEALTNGSTMRIFKNRDEVNKVCLMKGTMPEKPGEIGIDRMYADNNDLSVGDEIESGGHTWKITGLVALSDYSALFSNNNDSMFDSVKFGVSVVCPEEFDSYKADQLNYSYAWKYNTEPKNEKAEKDISEDLMEDVAKEVTLEEFVPRYTNQAIIFTGDDMGGDRSMMIVLLYIIIVIMAFVFAITTNNTIRKEANVIGTLRASGYTRGELIRHYMTAPVFVTFIGAIIGNIIGYTVGKDYCAGLYYGSYSLPTYVTIWNAEAFLLTTVVPILIMLVVNSVLLWYKLKLSPLKFLRRDLSRRKQKHALPLSEHLGFFHRFRIRVILQNMSNYAVLFVGIIFANMLLMFGLMLPSVLDHYQVEMENGMLSKYQYMLQMPASMAGGDSKLEQMVSMMMFSQAVETENPDAEKFSAYLLSTLPGKYKSEEIILYGVENNSKYINIKWKTSDSASDTDVKNVENIPEVYLSSGYAEKFSLKKGDTITLKEKYENKKYKFKVAGVYDYVGSLSIFMPIQELNKTFDMDKDSFSGYFSDSEITDIDEKYIGSTIDVEDLTKISRQLDVSMGSMMNLMDGFSVIIFLVLIYLLSKIIIEKNAQSISMAKILGYTNGEISRLYIMSTSIVVVLFILISLPLELEIMQILFREMMLTSITGWITFYIDPKIFVEMFVIGMAAYAIVAAIEYRRIRKVPMDEALKNVE